MKNKKSLGLKLLSVTAFAGFAATLSPVANAGFWGSAFGAGVGSYIGTSMANANRPQSSGGSASYYGGDTYSTTNVYVDMTPVKDAITAGDQQITAAIRTADDHVWRQEDRDALRKYYGLDQIGSAIGVDIDGADARKFVLEHGKAELQKRIERSATNVKVDVVLADEIARALRGRTSLGANAGNEDFKSSFAPFRADALVAIVDWSRRNPGKALPADLANGTITDGSSKMSARDQKALIAMIGTLASQAAKSNIIGEVSYGNLMSNDLVQGKIIAVGDAWHDSVARGLNALSGDHAILDYCQRGYAADRAREEGYLAKVKDRYFGGDLQFVSSISRELEARAQTLTPAQFAYELDRETRYDSVMAENANRANATAAKRNLANWADKCSVASVDASAIDSINALRIVQPAVAAVPGSAIGDAVSKSVGTLDVATQDAVIKFAPAN